MDYNKYLEIASSYLEFHSDGSFYEGACGDLEDTPDEIAGLFEVHIGASKVVLVPLNEQYEYAIKIPLKGNLNNVYRSQYCNNHSDCSQIKNQKSCPDCSECFNFKSFSKDLKYIKSYFENANYSLGKHMEDYFDFERLNWDYCLIESLIYQLAQKNKVEEFFTATFYIGEYNEIPIYLQKKVDLVGVNRKNKPSEKSMELALKLISPIDVTLFTGHLIDYYGEEKVMNLIEFFKEVPVNDLHSGNIGFINFIPVIFDYSGYHD